MRTNFNFRAVTALAIGVLSGGKGALAWCPTSSINTISCSSCTIVLSCDVYNKSINITGGGVIFDGNWYNIYNSGTTNGFYINGNTATTTIKNLYINLGTGTGIEVSQSYNWDNLKLTNVYVNGGTHGLNHHQNGKVEITGGSYWDNVYGIYGTGGGNYGEGIRISGGSAWANTNSGVYLNQKPNSRMSNGFSAHGNARGAYLVNSQYANITNSYFDTNSNGTSGTGLELSSSPNYVITGNSGTGNSGYDCKVSGAGTGSSYSNSWGTSSGDCN